MSDTQTQALPTFSGLQWHYVENLAKHAREHRRRYYEVGGPWHLSLRELRLAREAERTLRSEAARTFAAMKTGEPQ